MHNPIYRFTSTPTAGKMTLDEIRSARENLIFLRGGLVPVDLALEIVDALLVLSQETHRWVTVAEAVRRSRRSPNYFRASTRRCGGRSRLELWKDEGLAHQNEDGLWTISEVVLDRLAEDTPVGDENEGDPEILRLIDN